MSRNQLKAGVLLSYLNLFISMLIPFAYTPIMLRMLGQAEYGLYSLSHSAVAYLSLLSFGFGSTLIRYIAKYRAEGKKSLEEKTFGFFLVVYCVLAFLVILGGVCIEENVTFIFRKGLSVQEISKMKVLVLIMAFNSALSFPVSVFSSVIVAHERYIFRRILDMLATIFAPVANLIALYLGYKSIGMSIAATIVQILILPIGIIYCIKVIKIRPKFGKLEFGLIKEMFSFSIFVFIGTIVDMLFWVTDKVILGMLAGSVSVAIYNVGATFNNIIMNISTSISGVLTPKITGMVVKDCSNKELTDLFIKIGRLQFIIIALVISGFTVFGQSFIELWAGQEYAEAYWIAILTMFPLSIPLIQNTGLSIVIAQNKHHFRSIIYLIIAILNVISTYILVPYWGGISAALCSCVAYLLGQGIVMNVYYYKVIKIDIPLFWRNIGKMAVIPSCMMVTGVLIQGILNINSWYIFLVAILAYTIIYTIAMFKWSLNQYEREVLKTTINNIRIKFGRR